MKVLSNCFRFENSVIVHSHTELETLLGFCQDGALEQKRGRVDNCFTGGKGEHDDQLGLASGTGCCS